MPAASRVNRAGIAALTARFLSDPQAQLRSAKSQLTRELRKVSANFGR